MRALVLSIGIIIFVVAAIIAIFLTFSSIQQKTEDTQEFRNIKSQLETCNDKLLSSATSGSTSSCTFSANRGEISVEGDSIYYKIVTEAELCTDTDWTPLNVEKNIYQSCIISGSSRLFQMRWNSRTILFQTIGGLIGKVSGIEISKNRDLEVSVDGKPIRGALLNIRKF